MIHTIPWLLTFILYSSTFMMLYRKAWEVRDYTHAYFILPVSLFIIWTKRGEIARIYKESAISGNKGKLPDLSMLIFGLLMFIFGWRQEYLMIQTLSLLFVIYGLLRYVYGPGITRELRFPLLYLILLVPPPTGILDNITMPMRYGVSIVCAGILKALNYPIVREGLVLTMGKEEIFMGAPCSGFRSLITMIALGLLYIYFIKANGRKSLILFLSIIPMALLGNLIRVLAMCLVTYHFGHEIGQGFYHDFSGVIVFVIMVLGLMGIEKLIK